MNNNNIIIHTIINVLSQ